MISWKALGVEWNVSFRNDHETTRDAEELIAVLQIVQADFAKYDMMLLPTSVFITLELVENKPTTLQNEASNGAICWTMCLERPEREPLPAAALNDRNRLLFANTATLLSRCSTLPPERFMEIVEEALKRGLSAKTFFVRPFFELYKEFLPANVVNAETHGALKNLGDGRVSSLPEHAQLAWKEGPGAGFTEERAKENITNRYRRLDRLCKITIPKIIASDKHSRFLTNLRERSYKDWHIMLIVANVVASHISNKKVWRGRSTPEYMQALSKMAFDIINGQHDRDLESLNVDEIDREMFEMQEKISYMAMLKTWNLTVHMDTPDLVAIRQVMDRRYMIKEIDVDHEELALTGP